MTLQHGIRNVLCNGNYLSFEVKKIRVQWTFHRDIMWQCYKFNLDLYCILIFNHRVHIIILTCVVKHIIVTKHCYVTTFKLNHIASRFTTCYAYCFTFA